MEEKQITVKEIIINIKTWLFYFIDNWKIIIVFCLLGSIAGISYSILFKPKYTANLTFALEEKASGGGGLGSIASQFGLNIGGADGGAFAGDNLIELLKSRFIIEKTLLTEVDINGNRSLLVNQFIKFNELDKDWFKDTALNKLKFNNKNRDTFTLQHDSVLGNIYRNISKNMLTVNKVDKKLSIIDVTVISEDQLFSKLFVENLVKNVTDFYIETKTLKLRSNIKLLEFRVDSVKRELSSAMYGRAVLSDQNTGLVRQSAAVPKIKEEMRVQMLGAMYGELIKNLEFSKLALMREEPLIQIIDKPILPLEKESFGKLKGIIFGNFFALFIVSIYLIIRKFIKDNIN